MLCAVIGIVASVIIRQILAVAGINDYVVAPLLTYAGLAVFATLLAWLLWFCHGAMLAVRQALGILVSLIALAGVLVTVVLATRRIDLRPRFFYNDTATTDIYTLSLHDALPISSSRAVMIWRTAPSPTFLTADSPNRIRPSTTAKSDMLEFTSGGSTSMPMSAHSDT